MGLAVSPELASEPPHSVPSTSSLTGIGSRGSSAASLSAWAHRPTACSTDLATPPASTSDTSSTSPPRPVSATAAESASQLGSDADNPTTIARLTLGCVTNAAIVRTGSSSEAENMLW